MTNSLKTVGKKILVFILALTVVFGLGSWTASVPSYAAAADGLTVYLVDKAGNDQTLAQWTYDSSQKTFTENGAEVALVKDFTDESNLTGEVNGKTYDFSEEGALVYTGLNKKPDPRCLSVTTKGILLEDLYDYAEDKAGIDLRGDTMMYLSDAGGFNDTFTYDQYWGLDKYYYPEWYAQETYSSEFDFSTATEKYVPTTLAIKGYHGTTGQTVEGLIASADDANSLRISSGLQKNGNKTIKEIEGTTYSQGDINEGMLSVKNVSVVRFTPEYNTITIDGGEETGTEGTDLVAEIPGATVSTSDNYFKAANGETVELTVTPDTGCEVMGVNIKDADDNVLDVTEKDGKWSFTMPASPVTVKVKIKKELTWAGGLDFSWYDENDVKSEYHISTPEQWEALAWICSEHLADLADYETTTNGNVTGIKGTVPTKQNTFEGVQFYLDNDIDMGGVNDEGVWSGPNYYPIGSQGIKDTSGNFYGVFYGSFDGQGHYVNNVYCNRGSGQSYQSVGLFGRVGAPDDETVYPANDITIENIGVTGYIHGGRSVGGVVGKTLHVASGNTVTIKNCVNKADVSSTDKKGLGGICGAFWNGAVMENCYSTGNITGGGNPKGAVVGGNEGTITNVYSTQDLAVAGQNATATASVTNGYSLKDKTLDEMILPSFAELLGDEFKASCGTPVLAWEDAVEHDLQKTDAVEVTCTEDGNIDFWTCDECGLVFSDEGETVIAAEDTVIPALGHDWNNGEITTVPTSTEPGEITYTCQNDPAHTYTEPIDASYMEEVEALKEAATDNVISANHDLASGDYTEDSVAELRDKIDALNELIDDETATEEAIKIAKAELMQAWRTLEPVDKAAAAELKAYTEAYDALVEKLIDVYNNVTPNKAVYTTSSYAGFQAAIDDAEALLEDTEATSNALTTAKTNILLAQKALVKKAANTMTVKATVKKFSVKKVKAGKKVFKAITVKKPVGTVTYKKAGGSAKLTVNAKNGKITLKKGTKKGTYKIKVSVKAAGNDNYKAAAKTVTVTVKVVK